MSAAQVSGSDDAVGLDPGRRLVLAHDLFGAGTEDAVQWVRPLAAISVFDSESFTGGMRMIAQHRCTF
jgi:hypothetical protein